MRSQKSKGEKLLSKLLREHISKEVKIKFKIIVFINFLGDTEVYITFKQREKNKEVITIINHNVKDIIKQIPFITEYLISDIRRELNADC